MTITTLPSRTLFRDASAVKRAAEKGPVFITDRGKPTLAVLNMADYHRLAGQPAQSLLDVMHGLDGGAPGVEFDPPRLEGQLAPADLKS